MDKDASLKQVINYYLQNEDLLRNISAMNLKLSFDKENYILTGNLDLLVNRNRNLEIVDFKVQKKQPINHPVVKKYLHQLYLFAYLLNQRCKRLIE